jgi:hypothetical protein
MRDMAFCHVAIVETKTLDVPFAADLSGFEHGSLLGLFSYTERIFVSNQHFVFLLFLAVGAGCGVYGSVVIYHRSFLGGGDHFEAGR